MEEAPLLFGIDPDETWEYVLKGQRESKDPAVFTLKAPTMATAAKREDFLSRMATLANKECPEAVKIARDNDGISAPGPDASKEDIAKYKRVEAATKAWLTAWGKMVQDNASEERAISRLILLEGVAGWKGLKTQSGKPISYEKNKGRVHEVLRGAIAAEICNAISQGASLSEEEKVGLPSPQESPVA